MSNKFLGLNSVNVFKEYIDKELSRVTNENRVITIQAYSYHKDGIVPVSPDGGGFDSKAVSIVYPNDWYSLSYVLSQLSDLDTALSEGSIWMTVGVLEGTELPIWSKPMKISGQNGISMKFAYSYNSNSNEKDRTQTPSGVNSENRIEYVWTKIGENEWEGPSIWAMYSKDAREILWRYKVTGENEIDENKKPITPNRPITGETDWNNDIANLTLSQEYPYMWMSYQIVPAGKQSNDDNWTEPVLFGHWGKDGENGNVPDYTQTLYHKGLSNGEISDINGIIQPTKPEYIEDALITDYIKDGWVELPTDLNDNLEDEEPIEDTSIWWQCTIKVDGKTNKVLSEESIGAVKRYNAIDGTAKPGQFTMNLYAWSETQNQPEMSDVLVGGWRPENYNYLPDKPFDENGNIVQKFNNPEASLWMITANITNLDENGKPVIMGSWSEPVKLTGPRGPISYDYRIESRYCIGTSEKPKYEPDDVEWTKDIPEITTQYPYIWVKNYLVYYKMKYASQPDVYTGEYPIIQDGETSVIIKDYKYFRLSGINGEDGNRKNSVIYTETNNTIDVISFSNDNLYIANSAEPITYNILLDNLVWVKGYTGKFANIGTANVTINAGKFKFIGSNTEKTTLTLLPQETVELVCYTKNDKQVLIVIGKDINN